jgi:hypothetical protein
MIKHTINENSSLLVDLIYESIADYLLCEVINASLNIIVHNIKDGILSKEEIIEMIKNIQQV